MLECTVTFDQPRTQVDYPAEWLDRPPIREPHRRDPGLGSLRQVVGGPKWSSGTSRRVYAELTRTPGRFPGIDEIAAVLCITARTLRRRLDEEDDLQGTAGERAPSLGRRPPVDLVPRGRRHRRRPGFQRRRELSPRLQALDGRTPANTGPEPRRRAPTELQCAQKSASNLRPSGAGRPVAHGGLAPTGSAAWVRVVPCDLPKADRLTDGLASDRAAALGRWTKPLARYPPG